MGKAGAQRTLAHQVNAAVWRGTVMHLNAALVGLGSWGQVLGRSVQGRSERIRIIRGVTRTPSKAAEFAKEMGIPIGSDFQSVISDQAVDAIILATPHSQHSEQVIAAAKAGKHVYVEKPLALKASDAEAAWQACKAADVVLAVGQNRRFLPAYQHLRERVLSGAFGPVLHVEANFSGPSGYRRAPGSWRTLRDESPAGGMTGKGVHMTDLMIDLLGSPSSLGLCSFRQVLEADMDDTTHLDLHFPGGSTARLTTITATPDVWRFQVFCARGWLEIRDSRTLTVRQLDGATEVIEFPETDIEHAALEAFAAAVVGEQPFPVTEAQAIANVRLLETIAAVPRDEARFGSTRPL